MKEEENNVEYILRVDGIVNAIRGLGVVIKEREFVDKVLRTLPMKYDSKVSTLEERNDIKLMIVDELHGIFTVYEMRTGQDGPSKKEATFKASKELKKSEALSKNQSEKLDDEEALFIKKLERDTVKYKENVPLKCFKSGRIGHFSQKCHYPPKKNSDDDEEPCCHKKDQKSKTMYKNKFKKKRKNSYSKEDNKDEEISEDEEILFMGTVTQEDDLDVEGEVDLKAES